MNIASSLVRAAERWPDRIALRDLDAPAAQRNITYSDVSRMSCAIASGLLSSGLKPGDRVALLMNNSWEYVVTFFGIAAAGLVAVPLNTRLLEGEHWHMLHDSQAKALVIESALLADRRKLSGMRGLQQFVTRGSIRSFYELLAAPPMNVVQSAPEELFSLMYTSGTTGLPKAVMLPHRAWIKTSDYVKKFLNYDSDDVTLHSAALTHGAGFLVLPTFEAGGCNLICAKFNAARVLKIMRDENVSNGFFVPSMIQMLLNEPPSPPIPSLKFLYYAGSAIGQPTLFGAMERFGPVLLQSFGQMEAPMFLTVLDSADHQNLANGVVSRLAHSAGRAAPGVEVRIVGDRDEDVMSGEMGEIVVRAPQMMLGYWNRADATAETMRGGWLYTGDIGRIDADDYLYVLDRKKDMIISGGANVYAREVEELLLKIDGIKEVAVFGLPDSKWGESVTAAIVSDGDKPSEASLIAFCKEHLPDYRRPKRYIWLNELPRNAYGKVLKRELRQRFSS